jgi:hypothetical protein
VIWPGTLPDWIPDDDLGARATASMLLAKVGSTRPWHLIALDLGLPLRFATAPPALMTRLRRTGAWPALLAALDELATRLEAVPPPVNYSRRRWAAADAQRLRRAIELARHQHRDLDTAVSDQVLAVLVWEAYTGGDIRLHRGAGPETIFDFTTSQRYPRHPRLSRPDVTALVAAVAATLHGLAGTLDTGPLGWRPP